LSKKEKFFIEKMEKEFSDLQRSVGGEVETMT
jgi:hypothetical protein